MYTNRRYTTNVRDATAPYGGPLPSEEFPGAGVLQDLALAPDPEIPLILARYTALRAWVLASLGTRGAVPEHAMIGAREQLAATGADWAEKEVLGAALDAGEGAAALALLETAARAADTVGHHHGARALREAVHRARWWKDGFPPPSTS